MEFLQPIFFWGLLGISIPIGIHLWNGRRGKVLDWAAMNWLSGLESQSSRSFKLEQLLLLVFRILMLTVLTLLSVGLWFDFLEKSDSNPIVHLVQPNSEVESEFRFEIEQALEKGEQIFWLAEGLPEYEIGDVLPATLKNTELQEALDLLPKSLDSLHLYASGLEREIGSNLFFVPKIPILKISTLDKREFSKEIISLDSALSLSVNENGLLQLDSVNQDSNPGFSGSIEFSFSLTDQEKRASILAALEAIEEVYGLGFSEVSENGKVVVTDQIPEILSKEKLYFLFGSGDRIVPQNVKNLENQAGLTWEELIEKGFLPEVILEPLVDFMGIHPLEKKLTVNQLEQQFIEIPDYQLAVLPNSSILLLVLFLILFGLERFYAYRLNL